MSVQNACRAYFHAPSILCDKESSPGWKVAAFIMAASYFTLVIPAIMALTLAISTLVGRCCIASVKATAPQMRPSDLLENLRSALNIDHLATWKDLPIEFDDNREDIMYFYNSLSCLCNNTFYDNNVTNKQFASSVKRANIEKLISNIKSNVDHPSKDEVIKALKNIRLLANQIG